VPSASTTAGARGSAPGTSRDPPLSPPSSSSSSWVSFGLGHRVRRPPSRFRFWCAQGEERGDGGVVLSLSSLSPLAGRPVPAVRCRTVGSDGYPLFSTQSACSSREGIDGDVGDACECCRRGLLVEHPIEEGVDSGETSSGESV